MICDEMCASVVKRVHAAVVQLHSFVVVEVGEHFNKHQALKLQCSSQRHITNHNDRDHIGAIVECVFRKSGC